MTPPHLGPVGQGGLRAPLPPLEHFLPPVDIPIVLAERNYSKAIIEADQRRGVMAHFDGSRTDRGAESWFDHPDFKLSYHRAYTDGGRRIGLAPLDHAAYHGGICRTAAGIQSANVAFYGLAITAGEGQEATAPQMESLCVDAAIIARWHATRGDDGWLASLVEGWFTGHNEWAIFNKRDNPSHPKLWGKLGRKSDPTGSDPERPVLSMRACEARIRELLNDWSHPLWKPFVPYL